MVDTVTRELFEMAVDTLPRVERLVQVLWSSVGAPLELIYALARNAELPSNLGVREALRAKVREPCMQLRPPRSVPPFLVGKVDEIELTGSVGREERIPVASARGISPALPSGYMPLVGAHFVPSDWTRRRSDAKVAPASLMGPGGPATLRGKARQLGASHEAVRQAMKALGLPTDQASRNARIRAMAAEGLPWPQIAAAVGLSPSAVRYVCRDLPPRPAGRRPRNGVMATSERADASVG